MRSVAASWLFTLCALGVAPAAEAQPSKPHTLAADKPSTCSCLTARTLSTPNRRCFGGSRRLAWRNYRRSWSGWPNASAEHSNARASWPAMPRAVISSSTADGPMDDLLGHSITYRVAVRPRAGQKVFSLQSVPARADEPRKDVAQYAGFSLHAGIGVEAEQREKLERLTRCVSRPPVSVERLDLTAQGQVRYRLKTPYRDGTTHIVLEPLDFIARLAALVPPPRVHLTRFHGVFAAHAALRAAITPAGRGTGARKRAVAPEPPAPKDIRMNWARRLKRVFGIEIEQCARCGGRLAGDREHRGAGGHRADSRAPARTG